MDGTMKYEFGQIEALAGDINSRVSAIEGILSDLGSKIDNLTSIWQGAADEGFQATKAKWFQASTDLNQVLKQIEIAVNQTNQDAMHTEKQNAARWNG